MKIVLLALGALAFAFAPAAFSSPPVLRPLSELIGVPVLERGGEPIGEVKDLVFDARDGAIAAITVEYGRWLRVGSHEAAFAPADFVLEGDHLLLRLPVAVLRRAAALGWPEWPALRASYVIGREVRDRLRRDSGAMVDLVIDFTDLRIRYAVVDLRDEWEESERLVRLPFSSFAFPREFGDYPTLRIRREQLGDGKRAEP